MRAGIAGVAKLLTCDTMMVDAVTVDSIQALCVARNRPQRAEPREEG
jgi:hypothetical protein